MLHSIEPAVHTINLLAISITIGVLSPIIGAAAAALYILKRSWFYVLDRHYPIMHAVEQHIDYKLPAVCLAQILVVQSIYVVVVLSIADLRWAGITVVVISWMSFGFACWRCRGLVSVREEVDHGWNQPVDKATTQNPSFELTEMLLSPQDDVDEDK